ncbi:MAG TPA: polysaccharide biosynthesis/export family protein [Novosphingobium sp.]|nr:polysaccharide biosynthesis/export family protein [Novosphingobium sp.]
MALLSCAACTNPSARNLPYGTDWPGAAQASADDSSGKLSEFDYIHPLDRLAIHVLGEPELTSDSYRVDKSGTVQIPLAGQVMAAGKTTAQVREEIIKRLAARYVRDPQVAVVVLEQSRLSFAVEGAVREPGIFDATADTTLLSALAQAKSPTNIARLSEVVIFRVMNGRRAGARFDLARIRRGEADDPRILPGDTVVVGHSNIKSAWREFLQAAPAFSIFYYLRN